MKLTDSEIATALLKFHKPECRENPMVWQVWEDGEITLTKGGEVFGYRRSHMQEFGDSRKALPFECMPGNFPWNEKHAFVIVENEGEALACRDFIFNLER